MEDGGAAALLPADLRPAVENEAHDGIGKEHASILREKGLEVLPDDGLDSTGPPLAPPRVGPPDSVDPAPSS